MDTEDAGGREPPTEPATASPDRDGAGRRGIEDEPTPRRLVGFTVVKVFDVTQTAGADLPVTERVAGPAPQGLWDALAGLLTDRGFSVVRNRRGAEDGYTDYTAREVAVRADLDDVNAVYVLAHEVGHAMLHTPNQFGGGTTRRCAGGREVEAESVAFLVSTFYGMDTARASFGYVGQWATEANPDDPVDAVLAAGKRVVDTADAVLDQVEQRLGRGGGGPTKRLGDRVRAGRAATADLAAHTADNADNADRAERAGAAAADPAPLTLFRVPPAGSDPPNPPPRSPQESTVDPDRLFAANAAAADYFGRRLGQHPPALEFLREHGIESAAGPRLPWQLGYAPARGWHLLTHLRDAAGGGFTDDELVAAGLARRHAPTGRVFAAFRDRVMFPVHDEQGRVVGFTARNLAGDGPKYLNTAGTDIYHKGRLLFGLGPLLRHPPPGDGPPVAVVVEGAADALAVQRMAAAVARSPGAAAIYPVATCGTRLTADHLALLARTLPAGAALAVAFDGDTAGRRAVDHAYPVTLGWPGRRFGLVLPDGHDPASLLAAADDPAAALHTLLAGLRPLAMIRLEHRLDEMLTAQQITDAARYPQDLVRATRAIADLFVDDPHVYRGLCQVAAGRLGVADTDVSQGVIAAWETRDVAVARVLASNPAALTTAPARADPPTEPATDAASAAAPHPPVATSMATGQGGRRWQADACAAYADPVTGAPAWAVADGVGDEAPAGDAAVLAAQVATYVAARSSAEAGIAAARAALNVHYAGWPPGQDGDAAIVVATAHDVDDATTFAVAWAGDARAYALQAGRLVQVSTDHTAAELRRAAGDDVPAGGVLDHVLTSSVRVGPIGTANVGRAGALLLCSDGIHRQVDPGVLAGALGPQRDPQAAAGLVAAAGRGGTDNATALVIHPTSGRRSVAGSPVALARVAGPAVDPGVGAVTADPADRADPLLGTAEMPAERSSGRIPGQHAGRHR